VLSARGTVIAITGAELIMKKIFALILTVAIAAALAAPVFAQGSRSCRSYETSRRSARTYYDNSRVYDNGQVYYDYGYRDRSFWDRHRDKLTMAIGTGAGAAIGGLIGGKRGAVIGAASGLGASALYTYKVRNRPVRY
jgi:YmgG-like glycine-zipper protein